MDFAKINADGLVMLGCGRMGGAMLDGWLKNGLKGSSVSVMKRSDSPALASQGVRVNQGHPDNPAVIVLAVKPQMMGEAISAVRPGDDTLIVTVAAGLPLSWYETPFPGAAVVWAMPNTPAAIGRGITSMVGNDAVTSKELDLAEGLLSAVGEVVRLDHQDQMPAAMALAGSGPAYVFHLIEAMAEGGASLGLSPEMATRLARATVTGAAALADQHASPAATLRENVTSPNGVTAAALQVLMDSQTGLAPLMVETLKAAIARNAELAK